MQTIMDKLAIVFAFLFARLVDVGSFFVTTDLGLILLGIAIFMVLVGAVVYIFSFRR